MQADIASLGHAPEADRSPDIQRRSPTQREQLEKLGRIDRDGGEPLWRVKKKYYWQQTFPAHKIVHIRHEYMPILGASNSIVYGMGSEPNANSARELKSFCIDGRLRAILQDVVDRKKKRASYSYVDFILTTANTWKTPIEDFTLIVERAYRRESLKDYVSFCWDGPVTKIDADHFSAHAVNLVPTRELRVGFFDVEE